MSTDALKKLREPFPPNQISLLPKPTKKREEMDRLPKGKCPECGGWHATSNVIHLSYVGHAALTDRLLDTDPAWTWEPLAMSPEGLPVMDHMGGMWIKLTVCGVTRLGYGHAGDKTGGDAIKEVIGDALRNAAMRFGAALDLWHKGDLHAHEEESGAISPTKESAKAAAKVIPEDRQSELQEMAIAAINYWKAANKQRSLEIALEVEDNEEKNYFWDLLKTESALRAYIKANARSS